MVKDILNRALDYVITNNKGNVNPYHNTGHNYNVYDHSMFLFQTLREEYKLKSTDRLELGLACLFHDFNHSGGKLNDSENINIAIKGLNQFLDDNPDIQVNRVNVENIIKATQFPHLDIELNVLQRIIRDADMMCTTSNNWLDAIISFASELNISLKEFIPGNIEWLDTIKAYTPYGQSHLKYRREDIKKDLIQMQTRLDI